MKKITVVIPNFNGIQYVERCLDSLKRQTFSEFDVIFVDNGSVDGSRELTEEKYPWVRIFCKQIEHTDCESFVKSGNWRNRNGSLPQRKAPVSV